MKKALSLLSLAVLTVGLLGSCSKINERIDGVEKRVENIENEKIASIENQIAAINSSIADLGQIRSDISSLKQSAVNHGQDISELQEADETLKNRIDNLKDYLDGTLTKYAEKDWAVATFATLEQLNATKTSLSALEGKVNKLGETFDGKLSDLKTELTNSITIAIDGVNASISTLEDRVSALEAMIQSVSITPAYSDGSVEALDSILTINCVVEPAEAVIALTKASLKVLVSTVKTKAMSLDTVSVTNLKVDAAKGIVTAKADISSELPLETGKALTVAVNVKNGLSDYTTKFYPVTLSQKVIVDDTADTTKVTIKADADFPESVMGNIKVEEGFKENKPTTIKVGGIGTVIFDAEATGKIKANAEQAGATSVFFKVEDVTTTKPVENADVVLEVTMKTVDENGTEVFNEDNAGEGAEVTIEIPIPEEKDVVFVNSVTLVNDAGEPIQGGVVPGSEDFDKEKGILSFKVNHFSKYAIDYVTSGQFVEVKGISLDKTSATLQVDDTLRLAAVIAPEDATDKRVTWSSSDTTKVKVDDTGKITAVAFGKATITVTTKDGNKTADCAVKVSETKTMADILGTNTGIPESQNLTPPANVWVKKTDKECKAFVGIDAEGDTLFVILKEGSGLAPLGIGMDDDFEKIDDNTYQRVEPSVGTFTIKMTEGKFTSYEFTAASGSAYEQFNGTYSAPVSKEYVEIAAKYDGSTVSTLRWYRQSLAITDSGKKAWKGGSGSAVKVPGTGEDVVVGDYFQWGTFTGFYGNGAGTDKGLLPYTSFTNTGCGDGSDAFTFKSGKQFNEEENAPYWSGSAYTKYNTTDGKTELDASDDVASIILGGTWRMPTTKEFQALKEVTYWAWDATDKGYYVYTPNPASDAGKVNDGTGTYNKADALLFFPAVGMGNEGTLYSDDNSIAFYLSRTLSLYSNLAHAYTMSIDKSEIHPDEEEITARGFGFSVRPVQDPAATYVAVTNVSLDVIAKEIEKGGNVQLNVTVAPATATQNGVYWTSSAPTVATVDATGKVTAKSAGTATITATTVDGSKTATCTVTVTAEIKTIADVLATAGDNAPSATNHWYDTKGNYIYTNGGQLLVYVSSFGASAGVALDNTVTPNGDNYLYSQGVLSFTFNMTEGVLTSIYVNFSVYGVNETFSPAPNSALKGVFSVSATKKVRFSKGNLQATYNSSASTYTWGFAANQYSYIGNAAGNTTIDSQTNGAVVDLFGWSTASTTYGISTSTLNKNYSGDFVDWGKAIDDKGTWSTLSKNEWAYLFNTRQVNGGTKGGKSYQIATINSDATSVDGMILYPDDYTSQTGATSYTSAEWKKMEQDGCVFLPAACSRKGSEVNGVGGVGGVFWSSTVSDKEMAYLAVFKDGRTPFVSDDNRCIGYSVRLVTEVPAAGVSGNGTEQYNNNSNPNWF